MCSIVERSFKRTMPHSVEVNMNNALDRLASHLRRMTKPTANCAKCGAERGSPISIGIWDATTFFERIPERMVRAGADRVVERGRRDEPTPMGTRRAGSVAVRHQIERVLEGQAAEGAQRVKQRHGSQRWMPRAVQLLGGDPPRPLLVQLWCDLDEHHKGAPAHAPTPS